MDVRDCYCLLVLLSLSVSGTNSVASNLHVMDGASSADLVGEDFFFEIVEPEELQFTYRVRPAKDFGAVFEPNTCMRHTRLVPLVPLDACNVPLNAALVKGHVAFAQRGECSFVHKTLVAQHAGARAIIITEGAGEDSAHLDQFIEMVDDRSSRPASIPAAFLLGRSGAHILQALQRRHMSYALIKLPVNMSYVPVHKMNQPPWVSW